MIDTHTHLYLEDFDEDRDEMLQRAVQAGIRQFFMPNIDSSSVERLLDAESRYPGLCIPMMGLHPCSVNENYQQELNIVRSWLDNKKFCAIGEIGIDLYWDSTFLEQQKKAFLMQTEWAMERGLPIIIHTRNSLDLVLEIIKPLKNPGLRGIFHCFGGTISQAETILELGFLLGIGGVLTFKNSGLCETVKKLPLEHMVLETDAPYLAPHPFRGKRNEESYLKVIVEKLAECKEISEEEIIVTTTENAKKNFGNVVQAKQTV
jgi:TatD DNase family protein